MIQLLANLTVAKQLPLLNGRLQIPFGSLLYAFSFTWIDLVNDHLGKRGARWLVVVTVLANLVVILWFTLYIHAPGTALWRADPQKQRAIEFVLGGVARIYAASLLTAFVAENTDITVFHFLKTRMPRVPRWARSLASNLVSAPTDAVLFATLAFAGTLPPSVVGTIAVTSALYKLSIAACSVPLIYVVHFKAEGDR